MYYDDILEIVGKNEGYITTQEVVSNGIDKKYLTNMVKDGTLVKLSRGYYGLPDYIEDDYYKISSKSKYVRFSGATALYLHHLSDRYPLVFHITLPNDYSGSLQKNKNVIISFVPKEIIDLGVMETKSPFGMTIKVYDVERTICDIIKKRNKTDPEIFSKALKAFASRKNKNLTKLSEYARILKIEKKVNEYMEVLL